MWHKSRNELGGQCTIAASRAPGKWYRDTPCLGTLNQDSDELLLSLLLYQDTIMREILSLPSLYLHTLQLFYMGCTQIHVVCLGLGHQALWATWEGFLYHSPKLCVICSLASSFQATEKMLNSQELIPLGPHEHQLLVQNSILMLFWNLSFKQLLSYLICTILNLHCFHL